jgi:hypothetical protein
MDKKFIDALIKKQGYYRQGNRRVFKAIKRRTGAGYHFRQFGGNTFYPRQKAQNAFGSGGAGAENTFGVLT